MVGGEEGIELAWEGGGERYGDSEGGETGEKRRGDI